MSDVAERFWAKVKKTETCWLWQGLSGAPAPGRAFYGRFSARGRSVAAHRYAYELVKGPIPEGLTIDHLCRVTLCVNPDHLEAVTNKENILRGFGPTALNATKTHCTYGHAFTPENTYRWFGTRQCRACTVLRMRRIRSLRRSLRPAQESNREDILRLINSSAKPHCIRGHPFDAKNTAVNKGGLRCKTCDAEWARQYRAAHPTANVESIRRYRARKAVKA